MSRRTPTAILACLLLSAGACRPGEAPRAADPSATPPLDDLEAQASYGMGHRLGSTFVDQAVSVDLDAEAFVLGLRDGLEGAKPRLADEQIEEALIRFQGRLADRQEEILRALGERFREEGRRFLERNAAEPGVRSLPSGLQYRVVRQGDGPTPGPGDSVYLRYVGSLSNGTVVDDSADLGGTVAVAVDEVMAGWREALLLMPVGSAWELAIPPELAFGSEAVPGRLVPPDAVLVYEIELLGIVPAED